MKEECVLDVLAELLGARAVFACADTEKACADEFLIQCESDGVGMGGR